jgi:hypothetical protein
MRVPKRAKKAHTPDAFQIRLTFSRSLPFLFSKEAAAGGVGAV